MMGRGRERGTPAYCPNPEEPSPSTRRRRSVEPPPEGYPVPPPDTTEKITQLVEDQMAVRMIGFIGAIVICVLPMWKVTAFIGYNIVTAQVFWEGLWMNCVVQSTGQMQCKIYDSLLALPQDLQAARALVIIAIIVCVFGIILGIAGGKCTSFVEGESTKVKVAIASGVIFIIAGVLVLVPVCWSANTIIRDFYNPSVTDAQRREMGPSLYIGFGAAALLILGGGILCSSCPPKEEDNYGVKYSQPRSVATSKAYV
ncbi:claudin e [Pimephales promelas]|nr:claudin e [Pimephales promelas]